MGSALLSFCVQGLNWELDMGAHGAMFINQNRSPNGTCDHAKQGDDVLFQCSDPGYTTGFASAPHPRSRMIHECSRVRVRGVSNALCRACTG